MGFLFAVVTLLSCCQASNFILSHVSRTDDAIIIDLDGSGYDVPFQGKNWYGQIANPGFITVPSFNPYPMMFRQQRPSGWPYPFAYPSSLNPAGVPSNKQFDGEYGGEEAIDDKQATATCGTGPTVIPTPRGLISERLVGAAQCQKGSLVALKKADGTIFGSGTLISDTKVLIAAQCVENQTSRYQGGLANVVLHEKYNAFNYANDIAILTPTYPVVLSKTVFPACLPLLNNDPDQYVDMTAVILGWGAGTDVGGPVVTLPSPGAWTVNWNQQLHHQG
ncbi:hypothetical protein DAPPUDRAFT_246444 [Daphnia pulex]|uniref:Peptidase S1 domain-containing protein n=1 Tax=Daphnia pulex TaxID=6669 RepID=E9GQI9_DAPPU|nr:hypothetical protein DAPPUDRAFT_246444 [Daphnia pulex]|eukprot:EFX78123.1 hypothetical protein DAPPUDRAFT_246444 [Daphnia pulex]